MPLADILGIIAIAVGLVGLVPLIDAIRDKCRERRGTITWETLKKAIERLYEDMQRGESYAPDYIVCVGRAGAVAGAMLSHHFRTKTIPIIVIAIDHVEVRLEDGSTHRTDTVIDCCSIKDGLKNVLLLSIDMVSAKTVQAARDELTRRQISPKIACVFWNPVAAIKPRFYAEKRDGQRLNYPWAKMRYEERPPVGDRPNDRIEPPGDGLNLPGNRAGAMDDPPSARESRGAADTMQKLGGTLIERVH